MVVIPGTPVMSTPTMPGCKQNPWFKLKVALEVLSLDRDDAGIARA